MASQGLIKYNGRPSVKKRKTVRGGAGSDARTARKRAGALLRGFVSKQFEDKRRRAERRRPGRRELEQGWE